MWEKLLSRLSEPSTYAGLGAVVSGVGVLGKINEAPAIADAVANAGAVVANGGGWTGALAAIGFGVVSVFMPERGRR